MWRAHPSSLPHPSSLRLSRTSQTTCTTTRLSQTLHGETTHLCLIDTLGSSLKGLRFPKCWNLLGTIIKGTIVPNSEHNLPPPKSTNTTIPLLTKLTHLFTTSGPLHLRLVVHPFTRHNDLLHIYTLPCLPLSYNNVDVNVTGSEAAGISSAHVI